MVLGKLLRDISTFCKDASSKILKINRTKGSANDAPNLIIGALHACIGDTVCEIIANVFFPILDGN